jgi:hypothetical protein
MVSTTSAYLLLGKIRYPLCWRLGGPHGRFRWARKISPPTGIRFPLRPACSESCQLSDHTEQQRDLTKSSNTCTLQGHTCRCQNVHSRRFSVSRGTTSLRLSSNGCQPVLHSHRYRLCRVTEHFYCCVETLHFWIEKDHRQAFFYNILKFKVKYFYLRDLSDITTCMLQ